MCQPHEIRVFIDSGENQTFAFPDGPTGKVGERLPVTGWPSNIFRLNVERVTERDGATHFWRDLFHGSRCELWETLFDAQGRIRTNLNGTASGFPILAPWGHASLSVQMWEDPAHRLETAYLLRVLEHYRLVVVVPGYEESRLPSTGASDRESERRNRARIRRALADWDHVSVGEALKALSEDIGDLKSLVMAQRRRVEPEEVSAAAYFFKRVVGSNLEQQQDFNLIYMSSLFDRLGKWSADKTFHDIVGHSAIGAESPTSIEEMRKLFEKKLRSWYGTTQVLQPNTYGAIGGGGEGPKFSPEARPASVEYRTCRDCARWLRHGVGPWVRHWKEKARQKNQNFIRLLFIDDELKAKNTTEGESSIVETYSNKNYDASIRDIFHLLSRKFHTQSDVKMRIDVLNQRSAVFPEGKCGGSLVHLDEFFQKELHKPILPTMIFRETGVDGELPMSGLPLEHYDAIFCDVDFPDPWGGPQVIHAISTYLERVQARSDGVQGAAGAKSFGPALIVLTSNNRFEQAHECLNLGAHGFVTKDRVLQAPIRLRHAIEDVERRAEAREKHARSADAAADRFGIRTNFRILHGLSLEHKSALKDTRPSKLVIGDAVDRDWLRRVPKADLHVHLGSSISLPVIEALAWNSTGRIVEQSPNAFKDQPPTGTGGPHAREVAVDVLKVVFGAAGLRLYEGYASDQDAGKAMDHAAAWFPRDGRGAPPRSAVRAEQPLSTMLERLDRPDDAVSTFQITGMVVVALSLLRAARELCADFDGDPGLAEKLREHVLKRTAPIWRVFQDVAGWGKDELPPWCKDRVPRVESLLWRLGKSLHPAAVSTELPQPNPDGKSVLAQTYDAIEHRIKIAVGDLADLLVSSKIATRGGWVLRRLQEIRDRENLRPVKELPGGESPDMRLVLGQVPTLSQLVVNPVAGDGSRIGLLAYLNGCDLLGSDHLQYPENVVLAAVDFVRQNVLDTIVYSEIRCETPGYTKAGMSALGATQLLQASFDVAAAYFNQKGLREAGLEKGTILARVNILLAAKRHKKREECTRVVSLLERYLEHDGARSLLVTECLDAPPWWGVSDIVGFDLSGNENHDKNEMKEEIRRLFKYNSPITIHAGEAASAESVWEAVYTYHARRIGHGLRLRENPRLMRYCVDEGICMELCPTSNTSTHGFPNIGNIDAYVAARNSAYPLRFYMEAGLEVCINTDNRSLNRPFDDELDEEKTALVNVDPDEPGISLTDEYLRAARLSGGLTRWEVLKLVRAGFKHAFLHRDEIAELLSAVEARLFGMVGQDPGTSWRDRDLNEQPRDHEDGPDDATPLPGEP